MIYQKSWSRWIIEGEKFTLTEDVIICLFSFLLLDNLSTSRGSFIMLIAWPAFIEIERVVGYLYSSCDKGRLLLAHKKEQFALYIRRIVNRIEFSQHREIRELHWTSITSIESFPLPFSFFFQGRKTPTDGNLFHLRNLLVYIRKYIDYRIYVYRMRTQNWKGLHGGIHLHPLPTWWAYRKAADMKTGAILLWIDQELVARVVETQANNSGSSARGRCWCYTSIIISDCKVSHVYKRGYCTDDKAPYLM